jgi:ketosteroid isomerase-like protein
MRTAHGAHLLFIGGTTMSSRLTRFTGVALFLASALACQAKAPAGLTDADKAAIKQVADSAVKIANTSKDFAAYAALYYAEDAVVLPPNQGSVTGRTAIAQWLTAFPPFSNMAFDQVDVDGAGDLAYVLGTYAMDVTMPGAAAPTHDEGKYIEIWRRQPDGAWKATRDIFNSSLPPAPPAETAKH